MPGWYIHMDSVARKALDDLAANATAAPIFAAQGLSAAKVRDVARANPAYAALGAIGPDIFFMLPDFKPPVGQMLWKLASAIIELYTAWDDNFLGPFESAMGPISDNLADEENALTGGLKDTLTTLFGEASSILNDFILKLILEQYDFFGLLSSGLQAGVDEQSFFWSDMLHYRETCHFAAALWKRASDPTIVPDPTNRARFQAFALGWMSHIATDVTGHAFVNQKVGGPYRVHWQRHHLVENHMDSQVYSADHGTQAIYDQMANAALHLWIAFNPDGSSRNSFFDAEPNPPYPPRRPWRRRRRPSRGVGRRLRPARRPRPVHLGRAEVGVLAKRDAAHERQGAGAVQAAQRRSERAGLVLPDDHQHTERHRAARDRRLRRAG